MNDFERALILGIKNDSLDMDTIDRYLKGQYDHVIVLMLGILINNITIMPFNDKHEILSYLSEVLDESKKNEIENKAFFSQNNNKD